MKILAYRGVSILSRLIQWRTWAAYSHIAVEISEGEIIDAWKGGVRRVSSPFEDHSDRTVVEIYGIKGLTPAGELAAAAFLRSQVGKPYDYRGVLRFVSRRDPDAENEKWFCSELAFAALAHGQVLLQERIEQHRVSPGLVVISPLLTFEHRLGCREDFEILTALSIARMNAARLRWPAGDIGVGAPA